jgi:hypothetical protein
MLELSVDQLTVEMRDCRRGWIAEVGVELLCWCRVGHIGVNLRTFPVILTQNPGMCRIERIDDCEPNFNDFASDSNL